jgi:hypothetical protein
VVPSLTQVRVRYDVPDLTAIPVGSETQERDGVIVQTEPLGFAARPVTVHSCKELPTMLVMNNQYPYRVQDVSGYTVLETAIGFKVKVTNRMNHVLKLAGTVFKLTVNGREVEMAAETYRMFTTGILIPGEQKEFTIRVGEWRRLPREATVEFDIIDIPTRTDDAGIATKTDRFGWTFGYKVESREADSEVSVREVRMTRREAARQCGYALLTPSDRSF